MKNYITEMFYKQRADFERNYGSYDEKYTYPEGVAIQKDLFYAEDHEKAHTLDVLYPKQAEGKLPVVVVVHGGGLLLGCKEFNRHFCARICERGYLVYNLEYRLVPDCLFYDQIADFFTALRYIGKDLTARGGDPDSVYAAGDSGGACLLVYATAVQNNGKVAAAVPAYEKWMADTVKIKGLGLVSGMFYTTRFDKIGLFLPRYLYGKSYKRSAFAAYLDPGCKEVAGSLPPCFLVTSGKDHLVKYTTDFEKALSAQGTPHRLLRFSDKDELVHAFSVYAPYMEESTEVVDKMLRFFREYQ